jgi:endo-1,4-beta-xylanase
MDAATTCDQDGFCNGSGACRLYSAGTSCGSATCSMPSQATAAPTCNGTGTCVTPMATACSPYMCNAGACRTTCTTNADCVMPNICAGGACVPSTNLRVDLRMFNTMNFAFITPNFRIFNLGTSAVPMSELTVRYWYTIDSAAPVPAQSAACDYSHLPNSCGSVAYNAPFFAVTPARTNADFYFQFGFTTGAGSIPAGGGGSDIQMRWNKNNFSNFTYTNDHSFNNQTANWVATPNVTVYRNGFLVYGTEPTAP